MVLLVVVGRLVTTGNNDVTILPKSLFAFMATITLTTSPVFDLPTMNWAYWSLSYELAFYLVVSIALLSRCPRTLIAAVFGLCILCFIFLLNCFDSPLLFWCNMLPLFLLGRFGFQCLDAGNHFPAGVQLIAALVAGIAMTSTVEVFVAGIATALVMMGSKVGDYQALKSRPGKLLQAIGEQSFSLYLLHVPIGVALFSRLRPVEDSSWAHVVFDIAVLIGCLIVAWVFYRIVEVPAHNWTRRFTIPIGTKKAAANL